MNIVAKKSLADRLREKADALQSKIDHSRRPMTQALTPKRSCEYDQRIHDSRNLEATQRAMRALADAHNAKEVPAGLEKLASTSQIAPLVRKPLVSGYYRVGTASDYADTTPVARKLQGMIAGRAPSESPEALATREIAKLERECRLNRLPGFFPTPIDIAQKMVAMVELRPGDLVLEPSAGSGRLIDAILEAEPAVLVHAIERSHELFKLLRHKQSLARFEVDCGDFLESVTPKSLYDAIIMNPPFEKSADAIHVLHAFENHLKPGGTLVAIVGSGTLTRSNGTAQTLQRLIDSTCGSIQSIPSGSFDDTGVSAAIVCLRKAEVTHA